MSKCVGEISCDVVCVSLLSHSLSSTGQSWSALTVHHALLTITETDIETENKKKKIRIISITITPYHVIY